MYKKACHLKAQSFLVWYFVWGVVFIQGAGQVHCLFIIVKYKRAGSVSLRVHRVGQLVHVPSTN